jgi:hemolysin III
MKKRTRLADRALPHYTIAEEIANTLTHTAGFLFGIAALILCLARSKSSIAIAASAVYGSSLILLYAVSSIYHSLKPSLGKKVLQVIDHCTSYLLIAGSYTPVVLIALMPVYPQVGWGLFVLEWALSALATTLTAIDLKKYNVFSYICYILMGWAILPFMSQARDVLTNQGFLLLLFGGIAYTIGAVLYGIGGKKRWMHSVFHVFVVLGSALQFLSVWLYAL